METNNHGCFVVTCYSTKYMKPISMRLSNNDAEAYVNESAAGIPVALELLTFTVVCPGWCGLTDPPSAPSICCLPAGPCPGHDSPHGIKKLRLSPSFPLPGSPTGVLGSKLKPCCAHAWKSPFAAMLKGQGGEDVESFPASWSCKAASGPRMLLHQVDWGLKKIWG